VSEDLPACPFCGKKETIKDHGDGQIECLLCQYRVNESVWRSRVGVPVLTLEMVKTEALCEALLDRCDDGMLCLHRNSTDEQHHRLTKWKGPTHACLGLLELIRVDLFNKDAEGAVPPNEEEGFWE
jgi:hypothetical protein